MIFTSIQSSRMVQSETKHSIHLKFQHLDSSFRSIQKPATDPYRMALVQEIFGKKIYERRHHTWPSVKATVPLAGVKSSRLAVPTRASQCRPTSPKCPATRITGSRSTLSGGGSSWPSTTPLISCIAHARGSRPIAYKTLN